MGKKVVAIVIFFFLLSAPLVARAASIRKGTFLELRGGVYHPSDSDKWDTAFGRKFSVFGGLKLSQEVLKNIEIGLSADYVHAKARDWSCLLCPYGTEPDLCHALSARISFLFPIWEEGLTMSMGKQDD